MPRKIMSFVTASIVLASVAMTMAFAQVKQLAGAQGDQPAQSGLALARSYLAGMESGDLKALTALFITNDQSSILENASDEGSWEHYRDHHLKPEMAVAKNFKFEVAKESEERFGDVILVQQTGNFSVEVKGESHKFRVAVSYVIIQADDQLRIAHLHWSSRPTPQASAQPK